MDRPLRYESTRLALQSVLANGSTGCLVSELEPHGPQVFDVGTGHGCGFER